MNFDRIIPGMELPPKGVVITSDLANRPARSVDYAREALSLSRLAQALAASPLEMIQLVTTEAMHLTGAPSSGFSLLVTRGDGRQQFEWLAMAGRYAGFDGGTTPFDASPCGATLALASPQLFRNVGRAFPEFVNADPPLVEGLVVPVYSPEGLPLGTIWVASHGAGPNFDSEDVRRMISLAGFAGAALDSLKQRDEARQQVLKSSSAYRDAVASESRKDDFMGALAHELRSPLSAILTAARALRSQEAQRERLVGMIERQARRMSSMVEDLLDLTRIGRGLMALRLDRHDLCALLGDAIEVARASIDSKGQRLTLQLPENAAFARCDSLRIQQVIINLLDNASKFTPPDGHIRVALRQEVGNVVISIRDDGAGLSQEEIRRIFGLYSQGGHDGTAHGLGIGLALCRQLVELHGGTLLASSEGPGTGSLFEATIPIEGPADGGDHPTVADSGFVAL